MKRQIVLDVSGVQWREKSVSGSGNRITIFDGSNQFSLEEGGDEFVRINRHSKDPDPAPSPYPLLRLPIGPRRKNGNGGPAVFPTNPTCVRCWRFV